MTGPSHAPQLLSETLRYAREREYTGWDYADGMSSELLAMVPVENRWLNLAVQETIKRAPINLRPYAGVIPRQSFKGTGLFAMANVNAARLFDRECYEREADDLLSWLVENRTPGYSGFCGSHQHRIQHPDRMGTLADPDVVSTGFAVQGLLAGEHLDPTYGEMARTAAEFVLTDLEYTEREDGARIKYVPSNTTEYYTVNAVGIGARILVDVYARFGGEELIECATALFDYIVSRQTADGGWYYRDPPESSHLSMDNHHNGFIIECLLRYEAITGADRYTDAIRRAVAFYRKTLFASDGAPNWDERRRYPKDIHAVAQGIIVFSEVGEFEFVERIIDWALGHLYGGGGRFYFREHRLYTKRYTLMRWCQAWMAYALSEYLIALRAEPISAGCRAS
ncbi:antibiotic ABC transporter permease [Natronorarus salvus]|uniref:antibiotic ABC transporter permease n=1 Tax=Natronorarus salvus TaxID=3117733 RepID=UPI002F25ED57